MLTIPIDEIEEYDEIKSIDEAADKLGWNFDGQMEDGDIIEYGRQKNKETLARIQIGRVTGSWSTLADKEAMREFGLPSWRKDKETWEI